MTLLSQYYQGSFIDQAIGNNAFSFEKRKNKRIYVPPFIRGTLADVQLGDEIVFSEICDDQEMNVTGLKHFVHIMESGKNIFIMDNHHHAFFCWACLGLKKSDAFSLAHVDQHKDTRCPAKEIDSHGLNLKTIWKYTQSVLNVGNFIPPALSLGWFSDVKQICSKEDFLRTEMHPKTILDIDLDIFSPLMSDSDDAFKIKYLRKWIHQVKVVTIATSPFFIDQKRALEILHQLL